MPYFFNAVTATISDCRKRINGISDELAIGCAFPDSSNFKNQSTVTKLSVINA